MNWYKRASKGTVTVFDRKVNLNRAGTYNSSNLDGDVDGTVYVSYAFDPATGNWDISIELKTKGDVSHDGDTIYNNVIATISVDGWHDTLTKQLSNIYPGDGEVSYSGDFWEKKLHTGHTHIDGTEVNIKIVANGEIKEKIPFNYLDAPAPNKYKRPRWGQ